MSAATSGTGTTRGTTRRWSSTTPPAYLQWEHNLDGPAGGDDAWFGVAVDGSQQVVATGISLGEGTELDLLLGRYRQNGPPTIQVSPMPLVAGQPATFTVTNVEPGAETYLAYSMVANGNGIRRIP